MKKTKRFLAVLMCATMTLTTLAGCGKSDKTDNKSGDEGGFNGLYAEKTAEERLIFDKRNIEGDADIEVFWFQTTARDDVKDAAALYKELYGGNVDFYFSSWSDRATDLALLNTANQLPDALLGFLEYDFPKFIDMGIFGEIADDEFDFKSEYIDSESVDSILTKNSKKYGIAVKDDPEMVIYNKEYIEKLGYETPYSMYKAGKWDWDAMKTLAKNLSYDSDKDGIIDHYGLSAWNLKALFCANNTWPLVKKDGKVTLNIDSAPMIEVFQYVYDMINIDKSMPADIYAAESGFENGNIAMFIERPYIIGSYIESGMKKENIEVAPIPKSKSATEYKSFFSPNMSAISNSCKNKQAALAFIECYISVQQAMSKTGPRETYGYFYTDQQKAAIEEARKNSSVEIIPTGYGSFDNQLTSVYSSIASNNTVSAAIELYKSKMQNELN